MFSYCHRLVRRGRSTPIYTHPCVLILAHLKIKSIKYYLLKPFGTRIHVPHVFPMLTSRGILVASTADLYMIFFFFHLEVMKSKSHIS